MRDELPEGKVLHINPPLEGRRWSAYWVVGKEGGCWKFAPIPPKESIFPPDQSKVPPEEFLLPDFLVKAYEPAAPGVESWDGTVILRGCCRVSGGVASLCN